jgi:hypothetical protein
VHLNGVFVSCISVLSARCGRPHWREVYRETRSLTGLDVLTFRARRTNRYSKIAWAIRTHHDASLRQVKITSASKAVSAGSAMR